MTHAPRRIVFRIPSLFPGQTPHEAAAHLVVAHASDTEPAAVVADGEAPGGPSGAVVTVVTSSLSEAVAAFESNLIRDALKTARGNRARAARLLGTTERIIGYKIRRYGIDPRRFRAERRPRVDEGSA